MSLVERQGHSTAGSEAAQMKNIPGRMTGTLLCMKQGCADEECPWKNDRDTSAGSGVLQMRNVPEK